MTRPTGEVVLWPGHGVYRVMYYSTQHGQTCAYLQGLEGQEPELEVPCWKLQSIPRPLSEYPPIPKENK